MFTDIISRSILILVTNKGLEKILSCDFQEKIKTNIYFIHFIVFLTSFTLVSFFDDSIDRIHLDYSTPNILLYSFLLYFLLVFVGKMEIIYTYPILFLCMIDVLVFKEVEKIDSNDKQKIDFFITVQQIIGYSILAIIALGVSIYYYKQRVEHKENFSHLLFFFGKFSCDRFVK
jgi:hypothetical protein